MLLTQTDTKLTISQSELKPKQKDIQMNSSFIYDITVPKNLGILVIMCFQRVLDQFLL
jgi:hypothetical protein